MEKYMQELSDKLLMLPLDDRLYLTELLMKSLRPVEDYPEEEYQEDLRRLREAEEHPETTISWEDLRRGWDGDTKKG
jgi:putative addiction module component (TIGR02574 family)